MHTGVRGNLYMEVSDQPDLQSVGAVNDTSAERI